MKSWKTDRLYRLIFSEVESLRDRLRTLEIRRGFPPDGFRVEERSSLDWASSPESSTLRDVWILDDFGVRLFPGLKHHPHDTGDLRGAYWQFGVVRFHIGDRRERVEIEFELGPGLGRSLEFDVQGADDSLDLVLHHESLTGSF